MDVDTSKSEITASEIRLLSEMADMHIELRVHTQMLTESVRDDIRLVAEAVAVVSTKLDALHP